MGSEEEMRRNAALLSWHVVITNLAYFALICLPSLLLLPQSLWAVGA